MRRMTLLLSALLAWAAPALPQTTVKLGDNERRVIPLFSSYDLDGEAADDDQVVTSANLADSTTYTIAAQPDTPRLIDMTVTDANSSTTAGTVAVTGKDSLGYTRVCTFDFGVVATRGSGVKTIPVTTGPAGSSCYLSSVDSVISSALTGEDGGGTDLVKVGYTTNAPTTWVLYGALKPIGPNGEHGVDAFSAYMETQKLTTSGAPSTTLTGDAAFANVVVGDLLLIPVAGADGERTPDGLATLEQRRVTVRSSADSITVNRSITVPTAGTSFYYRHRYVSSDPTDQMYVDVRGWKTAAVNWSIAANADTGGVIATLQGAEAQTPGWPTLPWMTVATTTTASGATQAPTYGTSTAPYVIDLQAASFAYLRFSVAFGTGDDADASPEDLTALLTLSSPTQATKAR